MVKATRVNCHIYTEETAASEILARQIDLEIALRERTVETKIAWAQLPKLCKPQCLGEPDIWCGDLCAMAVDTSAMLSDVAYGAKDKSTTAFQHQWREILRAL